MKALIYIAIFIGAAHYFGRLDEVEAIGSTIFSIAIEFVNLVIETLFEAAGKGV